MSAKKRKAEQSSKDDNESKGDDDQSSENLEDKIEEKRTEACRMTREAMGDMNCQVSYTMHLIDTVPDEISTEERGLFVDYGTCGFYVHFDGSLSAKVGEMTYASTFQYPKVANIIQNELNKAKRKH